MTRVVALLVAAVVAAGAGVAPSAADAGGCHVCLVDLFGSDCGAEAANAGASCCDLHPTDPAEQPAAPSDSPSDDCPCPCSACCLPLGRAPVAVSTGGALNLSMQPALSPAVAPVLGRPVGVHTSVFHPPRA